MVLLSGCTQTNVSAVTNTDTSLTAIITSDLHYTEHSESTQAIVPLVSYASQFTETLVNQVIAEHPDVFILTGDDTNGGNEEDIEALVTYLQKLKDNGIQVIVLPGNHDYDYSDAATFEQYYFPLLHITSKDTDSNSYSTIINNVRFLAMDDGNESDGAIGSFSDTTMQWLETQLKQAQTNGEKAIFLSHHSVLFEDSDELHRYTITNSNLSALLQKYNVQLCLTGHQHTQGLLQENDMYEIISSMPMSGSHLIGTLSIEGNKVSYSASSIDFESYADSDFLTIVQSLDASSFEDTRAVFEPIFDEKEISKQDQDGIFNLFARFMQYAQEGSILSHYEEITEDPYLDLMLEALADRNYGPWMQSVLENPPLDATQLAFIWK